MRLISVALVLAVFACGGAGGGSASPSPSSLGLAALKYRIVDQVGTPLYCDPDFFPVARADEDARARERFPEIRSDAETFGAIVARLGLAATGTHSADQQLAIYREWKMLRSFELTAAGSAFTFAIRVAAPATVAELVEGRIDRSGAIGQLKRTPSGPPACPICLAAGTTIATPVGDVAVETLRVGDLVWTGNGSARVAAPLVAVGRSPVPGSHVVVHLTLADGRAVRVSPGHPTIDGRTVADLARGDSYDGSTVASAIRQPYVGRYTYDLLPAGASRSYWAGGIALGSTLATSR